MTATTTPLSDTETAAAADCYEKSTRIIAGCVGAFAARYNSTRLDDLRADANLIFVAAWKDWQTTDWISDDEDGGWSVFLRRRIWFRLLDTHRTTIRRSVRHGLLGGDAVDSLTARATDTYAETLAETLSADAATVLKMCFSPPPIVADEVEDRGGQPRNLRAALRSYLHTSLGWTARRVAESFGEIKKALQ